MSLWISEQRALEQPYQDALKETERMASVIDQIKQDMLSDPNELTAAYPGDMNAMMERMLTVLTELRAGRTNTPSAIYYLETLHNEMADEAAQFMADQ